MARRDAEDASRSDSLSVSDLLRAAGREDILTNRRRRRPAEVSGPGKAQPRPGHPEQPADPESDPVPAEGGGSSVRESPVAVADVAIPGADQTTSAHQSDQPERSPGTAPPGPVAQMAELARTEALAKLAEREPSWFTLAEFSQPIRPVEVPSLPLAVVKAAVEAADFVRPQRQPEPVQVNENDADLVEPTDDPYPPAHGVVVQWLLVIGELGLAVGLGIALSYAFRLLWDVAPYLAAVSAPVAVCALVGNVGWVRKRLGLGALPLWLLLVVLFVAMLLVVLPAAWILSGQ